MAAILFINVLAVVGLFLLTRKVEVLIVLIMRRALLIAGFAIRLYDGLLCPLSGDVHTLLVKSNDLLGQLFQILAAPASINLLHRMPVFSPITASTAHL